MTVWLEPAICILFWELYLWSCIYLELYVFGVIYCDVVGVYIGVVDRGVCGATFIVYIGVVGELVLELCSSGVLDISCSRVVLVLGVGFLCRFVLYQELY